MNIQSVSQTNPSFEQLRTPRNLKFFNEKISRKELLKNSAIKDNMDRFDIVFKLKEKKYKEGPFSLGQIVALSTLAGSGLTSMAMYMVTSLWIPTIISGIVGGAFAICKCLNNRVINANKSSYGEYELFGKKKYADGTEIKTEAIPVKFNVHDSDIANTVEQLKNADKFVFMNTVADNYPENGIFDSKSILKILNSPNIKKDFANGEAFNFSIDINGNETLLTKFSELSREEEKTKEYQEIVSIIKSTPNIDFYQKDTVGISVIENILNMENSTALDLVKDLEFEHSEYIDSLFNNIKDEDFKAKARNLKIKFKDAVRVLNRRTDGLQKFEEAILSQLESPFCDSQKTAYEVWKRIFIIAKDNKEILSAVNKILYKYLPKNLRME